MRYIQLLYVIYVHCYYVQLIVLVLEVNGNYSERSTAVCCEGVWVLCTCIFLTR